MGIRSKQPSDLKNPVPGSDAESEANATVAQAAAQKIPAQAAQAQAPDSAQSAPAAPADGQAQVDPSNLSSDEAAAFQQLSQGNYVPQTQDLPDDDKSLLQQLADNNSFIDQADAKPAGTFADSSEDNGLGFVQEMKARAVAGLGRNGNEEKSLLSKALGSSFEVTEKGDKLFFRKKGSNKFFPLDKDAFSGGLREVVGDLMDMSGDALGTAASVGGEATAIAGGALAGGGANPVTAGVAGYVAGPAMAAAAQVAAREAAVQYFQGQTSTDLSKEFMFNTGLNMATLGLGSVLKSAGKKALGALQDVMENSPMNRVEQLASIRQSFEEISSQVMGKFRPGTLAKSEAGNKAMDAIDMLNDRLDKALDFTRKDSVSAAAGQVLPVDKYADELANQLESAGIQKSIQPLMAYPEQRAHVMAQLRANKVLGSDTGADFIERLIDEQQSISKTGGLRMDQLWNSLDYWKQSAGYKNGAKIEFPDVAMGMSRDLRSALADDRNNNLTNLYSKADPSTGQFMLDSLKEYTGNIDSIVKFKKIFKTSKESAEKFTDALVRPNNSQQVRDFKQLVGGDSDEMGLLRAEWFDRVFRSSVDDSTGIVRPELLKKTLSTYGDDVVNEMLDPAQKHGLDFIVKKAEKIPYNDILNMSDKDKQMIQDTAQVALLQQRHPGVITRLIWNVFQNNADAAKYLADDGLLNLAVTSDPQKKPLLLKVVQGFRKMMDATDVVQKGDRKVLQPMDFEEKFKDPEVRKILMNTQRRLGQGQQSQVSLPGAAALGISNKLNGMMPSAPPPAPGQQQ